MKPCTAKLAGELTGAMSSGVLGFLVKSGIDKVTAQKAAKAAEVAAKTAAKELAEELAKNKDFAENEAFRMRFGD